MKLPFYCVLLFLISCHSKPVTNEQKRKAFNDSLDAVQKEKDSLFRQQLYVPDSVVMEDFDGDTPRVYSARSFNRIIDLFPILYDTIPARPDMSYASSGYFRNYTDSTGEEQTINFDSEAGRDSYYMLYAYFLRKRNGIEQLAGRRDTLIKIYRDINSIFGHLVYGGTYFGHQYLRILGYVEYDLYLYLYSLKYPDTTDMYSIAKQKQFYIGLLRQKITDEIKNDMNITTPDKIPMQKELFEEVAQIEKLITDKFYLESAIGFQYNHY